MEYIGGDGQTESNITNRLGNPGEYDAFAINMVKTDNGSSYTSLLGLASSVTGAGEGSLLLGPFVRHGMSTLSISKG